MSQATLVYPHQLFADSPALNASRVVYLIEESLLFTHNPIHRQKLIFHKLSMDTYQQTLTDQGFSVTRLTIAEHHDSAAVFKRLQADKITTIHVVDTTDYYLEAAITKSGLTRVWYESPLFILPKQEAVERYQTSKKFMARFYQQLRQDKNILLDEDGKPMGGKWSFDADNRKKLPKSITLPADITLNTNDEITAAITWATHVTAEQYGAAGCWLPYTHKGAQEFLSEFLCARFKDFGIYEDAISSRGTRLFHSTISPLLNVGLLTPNEVLDTAIDYALQHDVPLNSLEGFVRQILGWREFIRASYECDGDTMRTQNFFNHSRTLAPSFWDGTTDSMPVDTVIKTALQYGYNHHIERLMVMGNFMLLTEHHPTEVYRWFMAMYVDAYDWVMVPNVYGMSQFADGGSFATKPYISGSNYLKKMSDYSSGDWEGVWTSLYWRFIGTHRKFFASNYRLSMMPRLLEKMPDDTRRTHQKRAQDFLDSLGQS